MDLLDLQNFATEVSLIAPNAITSFGFAGLGVFYLRVTWEIKGGRNGEQQWAFPPFMLGYMSPEFRKHHLEIMLHELKRMVIETSAPPA